MAKRRNRGKTPFALFSPRKNGLTSLFKVVRVFKVRVAGLVAPNRVAP